MENTAIARKVGAFVVVALAIIAVLLLNFSKGASLFTPTYRVRVEAVNVGGLKKGAPVLMAGVQIGVVRDMDLSEDGRHVVIDCSIFRRYKIHGDARCELEQSGFLGDQFVAFVATTNALPPLGDGAVVRAQSPFNLQEAARSAIGLMEKLDTIVERVDRILLHPDSLVTLTNAFVNLRSVTQKAGSTLDQIERLVVSNTPAVTGAVSNVNAFAARLGEVADLVARAGTNANVVLADVAELVRTNRVPIQGFLANLDASTANLKLLLSDLQGGKGMAGALLKDPALEARLHDIASNFSILSSNLNRYGLLYKPKNIAPLKSTPGSGGRSPF